jgi:hypothetical protein
MKKPKEHDYSQYMSFIAAERDYYKQRCDAAIELLREAQKHLPHYPKSALELDAKIDTLLGDE